MTKPIVETSESSRFAEDVKSKSYQVVRIVRDELNGHYRLVAVKTIGDEATFGTEESGNLRVLAKHLEGAADWLDRKEEKGEPEVARPIGAGDVVRWPSTCKVWVVLMVIPGGCQRLVLAAKSPHKGYGYELKFLLLHEAIVLKRCQPEPGMVVHHPRFGDGVVCGHDVNYFDGTTILDGAGSGDLRIVRIPELKLRELLGLEETP